MLVLCIGGPLDGEEREVRDPPPLSYNFTLAIETSKVLGTITGMPDVSVKAYPMHRYERVVLHDPAGTWYLYVSAATIKEGVVSRLILNYNPRVSRDQVELWRVIIKWCRDHSLSASDATELLAAIKACERPV